MNYLSLTGELCGFDVRLWHWIELWKMQDIVPKLFWWNFRVPFSSFLSSAAISSSNQNTYANSIYVAISYHKECLTMSDIHSFPDPLAHESIRRNLVESIPAVPIPTHPLPPWALVGHFSLLPSRGRAGVHLGAFDGSWFSLDGTLSSFQRKVIVITYV